MAPPNMAPPTFMTQRKYIQLISLAKKLDACKNELLRYRRGEKTAVLPTSIAPVGEGYTGLSIAGQNKPTNMERRLPKSERNMAGGKRNKIKSVASEPTLGVTKRNVTPQMGRKKRHSDPTPLKKSFSKEGNSNGQNIKDEGVVPRVYLAKGATFSEYKAKKKKKKKIQNKAQISSHHKGTQNSRKKKKKFCTLPKTDFSKRITSVARCNKKWVLHKEGNSEYTFRSPEGGGDLTTWNRENHSGNNQMVPCQVKEKLDLMPLVHTNQVMERPPDISPMLSNSTKKKKSIPLSTERGKQPLTKPSKNERTSDLESHLANDTKKRQDEPAAKKGIPLYKGVEISRRKLRSVSRCTTQSAKHTRPQLSSSRGSLQKGISTRGACATLDKTVGNTQKRAKRVLPSRPSLRASPLRNAKRKRQSVTRKTATKRSLLHAPPTQQRYLDHQDGEKQRANRKTVKDFMKALNNSSVIICTNGHKKRPKRGRRKCLHTRV
ncbi:conserved Plasmodium protein, unknown function [Plasmodium knowlesi strain H]|uniref:Uncharacterized protein n=3 Tax=Plasmodium knowlesi TaxID=5850 RepID=A0A5K1VN38_PLAKH|nr:conserved Plasmodium protein, unknown function [Plasmodium knowlesi strain H]OTN68401.1 Uncharacterized protein PKNOH_S03316700 [Plasmodium knowlesi]CAA9987069.1 conserved Plasmodium protein, unknown function [Plasmodium knowlesi strain H]SBO23793.1 conserved Plasmodium protein, unknown function [Plasmodium knowlesi strain H]SBO25528.1 conserved Plasmodium protein, unknown function [Plasmodium knowlesi strain H]VVS76543.1 conserved Plasmodium protein, unknown function [Plasmodium knowlesi s|eukprot:XP_002261692.1 hypothetical protein, conserved in Plasmodium species [Plasmodium knowlesi strain H]